MKKLACVLAAVLGVTLAAHATQPMRIGEEIVKQYETPHPYASSALLEADVVWRDVITHPGAAYIAPHFSRFNLAEGDYVIVRSPDGTRSWKYEGAGKEDLGVNGEGFWAIHVYGDTAIVELYAKSRDGEFGYTIDRYARGFQPDEMIPPGPEAICGADDSNWAKCYQTSEPVIYDKSRAVGRIVIQGTSACTMWLIGNAGHIMTNNHCIGTQAAASNTTYEFMAEGATCTTNCATFGGCPGTIVANSGTLIQTEANLDFTLIQLPVNVSSTYGFLKLRTTLVALDERIYIPGHPGAWGKRFAVLSDHASDASGFCEVFTLTAPVCVGGTTPEIGYMCDTQGGSSGSPVLAYSDHRVVSLHHCANCPNRGTRIPNIITALGANLPPGSITQLNGTVDLDKNRYGCATLVAIHVKDDSIQGAGSQAVTIASTTEPMAETVVLTESPAGSGDFFGNIPTTTGSAVGGDGLLSVANGDTITVTYIDADDGAGGTNIPRTDTAAVDCIAPVISNVQAQNVTGNMANITWNTSEPANSTVQYGTTPPPSSVASATALVTSHNVKLTGLAECSNHVFSVRSADEAGNAASDDNAGVYYSFATGRNVNPTYVSTNVPVAIPDNNPTGATSSLTVPDNKTILDVDVKVKITHTFTGDLILSLIGPDGTTVILSNRRGGSGDNFNDTIFDDQAATPIASGTPPFAGSFRPDQPLAAFNNKLSAGTWTFKVVDAAAIDVGTIDKFELTFTYPAQACGPHAKGESRALVGDACSGTGSGGDNGVWDAGEDATISVTLRNDGTDVLTGVTATLVPTTPGVTMVTPTASYASIPVEATGTSLPPHFKARLPQGFACGSPVNFQVMISTDQGSWSDTISSLIAGAPFSGDGVALMESFASGIPATWTVVDGGTGGGAAATWTTANPGARAASAPIAVPFAIVDSDNASTGATQDEQLISPVMNLGTATTVTLEFDHWFRWFSGGQNEKGDVDVRSSLTGGAWTNVYRAQGGSVPASCTAATCPTPDHRTINITAQAAGATDVQIRFRYYDASFEWWWMIDNVKVSFTAPAGCSMNVCTPLVGLPPPVPATMTVGKNLPDASSLTVNWSGVCSVAGTKILYGSLGSLPSYALAGSKCAIANPDTWAVGAAENLWFVLVNDDGSTTEGSWGLATSGERNGLSPSGTCGATTKDTSASCP